MKDYKSLYFVGAGGIGMAALERYFLALGKKVAGYDRTPSELTHALVEEGVEIVFDENPSLIPDYCRDPETTLVVYTPAVPDSHAGLRYFRHIEHGSAHPYRGRRRLQRLLGRCVAQLRQ